MSIKAKTMNIKAKHEDDANEKPECFVIMPISELPDYPQNHFLRVYEDIFSPACELAGFKPVRADQVVQTNLIHTDILQRLIKSPMVLCDLSSRNPNVLFELGIRQAFDQPVALVQEEDNPKIFDISPLRITNYRKARMYDQVLEDQTRIAEAITATANAAADPQNINSIVKLLGLQQAASIPEIQATSNDPTARFILAEISALRSEMQQATKGNKIINDRMLNITKEIDRLGAELHNCLRNISIYEGLPEKEISGKIFEDLTFITARLKLIHSKLQELQTSAIAMTDQSNVNYLSEKATDAIDRCRRLKVRYRANIQASQDKQ